MFEPRVTYKYRTILENMWHKYLGTGFIIVMDVRPIQGVGGLSRISSIYFHIKPGKWVSMEATVQLLTKCLWARKVGKIWLRLKSVSNGDIVIFYWVWIKESNGHTTHDSSQLQITDHMLKKYICRPLNWTIAYYFDSIWNQYRKNTVIDI